MKILLIDNYDSFTYNLLHYLEGFDVDVDVYRNDAIPFDKISSYDKIVLSPGPGLPLDAGNLPQLISDYVDKIPMMGVCLGFQAIVAYFGGSLFNQAEVKHGIAEKCKFESNSILFNNLPDSFPVGLYHSWAVEKPNFPKELKVTAMSEQGIIMAFEHKNLPVCGVQFHPESILTEHGHQIVENFLCYFN